MCNNLEDLFLRATVDPQRKWTETAPNESRLPAFDLCIPGPPNVRSYHVIVAQFRKQSDGMDTIEANRAAACRI